jgi:hypothetical protein
MTFCREFWKAHYNWTRVLLRTWIMDAGMSGHIGNRRTTRRPVMLLALAPANDGGILLISDSWRYYAPKMESLVRVLRQSS